MIKPARDIVRSIFRWVGWLALVLLVALAGLWAAIRVPRAYYRRKALKPPSAFIVEDAPIEKSSENIGPDFDFVVRSGRAILYPIYLGTYERRITSNSVRQTPEEIVRPGSACLPVGPNGSRDLVPEWAKDIGRSIDYLETRSDIDSRHLGFMGLSLGAVWGPVLTAVEPRFKASVLVGGGLPFEKLPSEIEPINFAPRVKTPTLMVNGQQDFIFPVETSQDPLFRLLGVAGADKRHATFDSGHLPPTEPSSMRRSRKSRPTWRPFLVVLFLTYFLPFSSPRPYRRSSGAKKTGLHCAGRANAVLPQLRSLLESSVLFALFFVESAEN